MSACRGCGMTLDRADVVCDLNAQPLANRLLTEADLAKPEVHWPLRPLVCRHCLLVQLPEAPQDAEVFGEDYPFYAGQSAAWRAHCADLVLALPGLEEGARVLELGSNDGTLLGVLREYRPDLRLLGVEPCRGVAEHALREGVPTDVAFWSAAYARGMRSEGYRADVVLATNVLAHASALGDFLDGVHAVLARKGVAVFEVPYVLDTIVGVQFDQVYAEHHCYFSLGSLGGALARSGLYLCDAERVPVHGGSLRVQVRRQGASGTQGAARVATLLEHEQALGFGDAQAYLDFAPAVAARKRWALRHLLVHPFPDAGGRVVGYGASAKAAVTLNYLGLGPEAVQFVADTTPAKQGKYLPGSRVPIVHPDALADHQPDVVVNFLWNWREESERNIHELCPSAGVVYLRPPERAELREVA